MSSSIIIDTETTDVKEPEVIELAWRTFPQIDGAPPVTGFRRFKPSGEIALGAVATHHILVEELEGCPSSSTAPSYVPPSEYWIGHNIDFDWRALGSPPIKRICTLAIARAIWPTLDSHTLVALMYHLGGRTPQIRTMVKEAHGAVADVEMCLPILSFIMSSKRLLTVDALWEFSEECRIPKVMSFGKFKGMPVSAVDRGWAGWYDRESSKTGDRDEYLIVALKRAGKL